MTSCKAGHLRTRPNSKKVKKQNKSLLGSIKALWKPIVFHTWGKWLRIEEEALSLSLGLMETLFVASLKNWRLATGLTDTLEHYLLN